MVHIFGIQSSSKIETPPSSLPPLSSPARCHTHHHRPSPAPPPCNVAMAYSIEAKPNQTKRIIWHWHYSKHFLVLDWAWFWQKFYCRLNYCCVLFVLNVWFVKWALIFPLLLSFASIAILNMTRLPFKQSQFASSIFKIFLLYVNPHTHSTTSHISLHHSHQSSFE